MICVSLANINFKDCINALSKSEFAEIRMDLLDFTDDQFNSVFSIKKKSVATCRPGNFDDFRRSDMLKSAVNAGAGYVDIEFESDKQYRKELVEFAKSHQCKVIISYHNFEITPDRKELEEIISKSRKMGADYVKIAVMANSRTDCARILALYENHPNLIAFCMGEKGSITRIAAPLLGAEFTFASLNKDIATAPGQLTIGQLMDVYDIL